MRSAALLSYAAAVDEQAVVNAVHSAPYVPAHDVAADVAQLRVLFEEMQLPVPTHAVHASNIMEHYFNQAKYLPDAHQYVDCTGMGDGRLQYVLTMLQAGRLQATSRKVNYILVPFSACHGQLYGPDYCCIVLHLCVPTHCRRGLYMLMYRCFTSGPLPMHFVFRIFKAQMSLLYLTGT